MGAATLLLDTHILLWLGSGDARLRPATRRLVDACWAEGGSVLLSAIAVWETALLVDRGRIHLDLPVAAWTERWLGHPGIEAAPLSASAAAQSYRLPHFESRDPADRLLIATAIERGCPLVTYDERIARFGRRHGAQCGFTAVA